jgi:hypothetical protein
LRLSIYAHPRKDRSGIIDTAKEIEMLRTIVWLAACSPLLFGGAALAHPHEGRRPPAAQTERGPTETGPTASEHAGRWTIVVVRLGYARAEEVARILSQLAPPDVTVTAYEPTNSLIIAGDPAPRRDGTPAQSEKARITNESRSAVSSR